VAITVTAGTVGTGSTSAAATVPTGTGGTLVLAVSSANSNGTAPTTPVGWTLAGSITSATGATGFGVDAGPRVASVYVKDEGTAEATVTVAATSSGNTRATSAQMLRFVSSQAGFSVAGVFASAAGPTANTTAYTATSGTSVAVASGDVLLSLTTLAVDTATVSSPVLSTTASPPAFGAATNRATTANGNGNDLRIVTHTSVASSAGTSTPRFTATLSAGSTGPTAFLRLREAGPATTPTAEVDLGSMVTPEVRTGHTVRIRARSVEGGGTLTYSLVEGTTVRATFTSTLTNLFQTYAGSVSEAQATTITNYNDLRVRWSVTKSAAPLTAQVSWVELEAPAGVQALQLVANPVDVAAATDTSTPVLTPGAAGFTSPTGLTAVVISASRIDLTWNPVASATGYDIERDGIVIVTDHATTSYSDTGLSIDTSYSYRVRSVSTV
jgi:hypothetical protein